ncbi:adenosylmethionine decarboxylase [Novosphingobium sp.]|uniref:adenosylmethionine decarboxylase n=1 Tax=Novosphingobium sp. TaxID=1874826 RepID=UPI0026198DC3|nr:adenosylmethionine decarboxylase [Novosphingobium sp.]
MAHLPGTSIHLIADLKSGSGLADAARVEAALRKAAAAVGARLIGIHVHGFGEGLGVTGVALLAESHISIHTWPETGVAAVDLFVCGKDVDAEAGLAAIVAAFDAAVTRLHHIARLQAD